MFRQIKKKTIFILALSMIFVLSGCSNSAKTEETSNEESVRRESDSTKSKIIHMDYGDVEIPENPQNVIVTFNHGDVIALGIIPVGATFSEGSAFEELAENITQIDGWEINPEELLSLKPDLIIWGSYDEKSYETLSKIAPTLAGDFYSMSYEERLRFF